MRILTRREFMKRSAVATAASLSAAGLLPAWGADTRFAGGMKRTLGRSGVQCSLLGMGTGTQAWNGSSAQNRKGRKAFVSLIEHAHASGVTYFDLADMYGAHDYMKDAMKNSVKREDAMLLTKTVSRDPSLIKADLERFRKELDTDYLDVVLLHCLTEPGWTAKLQPCMDVLADAKAKGIIRAHGCSCHNFGAMETAADSPWTDVLLARINPFGIKMDTKNLTPEGKPKDVLNEQEVLDVVAVLKKAHDNGVGVLGMKIAGEGAAKDRIAESLQFVLSTGVVDALNIGVLDPAEIDANLRFVEQVRVA
ncbi:MAG: twin-arginine translocation signal domain-containing protein [Candidatus Hydrogenedentes bacterium]|nr:twin-arginine translocation signal domain-containing protein [Candidatus Hydrogenedentota bacterium]